MCAPRCLGFQGHKLQRRREDSRAPGKPLVQHFQMMGRPLFPLRGTWMPGQKVGRYVVVGKLATGGMAEIWLARQAGPKGFEKVVVIKKITDAFCDDPEFVDMFLNEARIAAQLNHPNVVQIYDLGEYEGAYFIAMEYLHGETLSAVLHAARKRGQHIPFQYSARWIADAAQGLAYAHARTGIDGKTLGIVHRDVSPRNLIVTYDGVVKLVDFGIARAADRATQTGHKLKGTPGYFSPEQARGESLDRRSDLFALGVVLFEAVTGTRLFEFEDALVVLSAIGGSRPVPRAIERNPSVPADLDDIVSRALQKRREDRYPSAGEFHAALEEWLHGQPDLARPEELQKYLRELLQDKLEQRQKQIEAARVGMDDNFTRTVEAERPTLGPREELHDSATATAPTSKKPRQRRRAALLIGASVLLVAGGIAVPWVLPTAGLVSLEPPVLILETQPSGARISVDEVDRGFSPLTLSDLPLGEHLVSATIPGHGAVTRTVRLERHGERVNFVLSLPGSRAMDAEEEQAAPGRAGTADVSGEPARTSKSIPRGRLTLETIPWTHVYVGKEELGYTPLVEVPLPAGRHLLRLVNPEERISKTVEVDVRPGQTTVKRLQL